MVKDYANSIRILSAVGAQKSEFSVPGTGYFEYGVLLERNVLELMRTGSGGEMSCIQLDFSLSGFDTPYN